MTLSGKSNTEGEGETVAEVVERLMHSAAVAIAFSACAVEDDRVARFSEGALHYFERALVDHLKVARSLGLNGRLPGGH